jgi:hypothetical protein
VDIGPWLSEGIPEGSWLQLDAVDVPHQFDVLPDGSETIVLGDVHGLADLAHQQGANVFGLEGTCGLCSCQDVLSQFGLNVSENDMILHAVENRQCELAADPAEAGGTSAETQAELLTDYGIPATVEQGRSLEDLAGDVEHDRGVIIETNAGVLWDDATYYGNGRANHAVSVIAVGRDPESGQIQGFYVNDSGPGIGGRFVGADTIAQAWLDAGGISVTTDVTRADAAALAGRTR